MSVSRFVVWYLRGRGPYGRWCSTIPYGSAVEARGYAAEVERMGYPCVVAPAGDPAPLWTDPAWWDFGAARRREGEPGEWAGPVPAEPYAAPLFSSQPCGDVVMEVAPGVSFVICRRSGRFFATGHNADWASTPVGWSDSLGAAVDACLAFRFPPAR